MKMNRVKYISLMTVAIAVIAIVMEFVMKSFFPSATSKWYLLIPAFYWLFYSVSAIFLFGKDTLAQLARIMMIVKGVKMILSLFLLLLLSFILRGEGLAVLANFLIYSTLLLFPESLGLISLKISLSGQRK